MDVPLSVIGAEVGKHLSRGGDGGAHNGDGGVRALLPLRLVCREWRDLAILGAASAELDLDVEEEDDAEEAAVKQHEQALNINRAPQLPAAVVAASSLFGGGPAASSPAAAALVSPNPPASTSAVVVVAPSSATTTPGPTTTTTTTTTTATSSGVVVGAPPPLLLLPGQQQQQGQQQQAAAAATAAAPAAAAGPGGSPSRSSSTASLSSSSSSPSSSSSSSHHHHHHPHSLSRRPRHPIDALARRCPRLESLALHVGPRVGTEQLAHALERAGRAFPRLAAVAVLFNDASTTLRREDVARLVQALHAGTTSPAGSSGSGDGSSGDGSGGGSRLRALAVRAAFAPDDADVFGGLALASASASASSTSSDAYYQQQQQQQHQHHSPFYHGRGPCHPSSPAAAADPPAPPALLLPRLEELRLLSGDPAVAPAAGGGLTDEHVRSLAAALGGSGSGSSGGSSARLRVLEFPGHARLFTGATLALLAPACPRLEALAVTPARAAPAFFAYERHAPCRNGGGKARPSFFAPSVLAPGGAASGVPVGIVGQADYTLSSDAALDALAALVVARGGSAAASAAGCAASSSSASSASSAALAAPPLDLEVGVPDARWAAALLARVDALHRMQLEIGGGCGAGAADGAAASSSTPALAPSLPLRLSAHVREPADGGAIAALCAAPGAAEGALVALALESRGAPTREDVAALGRLRGLERLALQCVRCSGGVVSAGARAAPAGGLGAALNANANANANANNAAPPPSSPPTTPTPSSPRTPTAAAPAPPLLDVLPGAWSGLSRLRALHLSVNPSWRAPLTPGAVRAAAEAWPGLEALHLRLGCTDAIGEGARAGGVERALAGFGRLRGLSLSWLGGEGSASSSFSAAAAHQAAAAAQASAQAAQAAHAAQAAAAAMAAADADQAGSSSSSSSSGNSNSSNGGTGAPPPGKAAEAAALAAAEAAPEAAAAATAAAMMSAATSTPALALAPPPLASSWPPRSGPSAAGGGAALLRRHAAAAGGGTASAAPAAALSRGLRRRSLDAMHGAGGSPVALDVAALPPTIEELALTSIHAVRLGVVVVVVAPGAAEGGSSSSASASSAPPPLLPNLRRLSVDGHFCVGDDTLEALVGGAAVQVGCGGGGGGGAVAVVGPTAGATAFAAAAPAAASPPAPRSSLEHLALTLVGRQPLTARGLQRALGGGGGASLRSLLVHDYRDGALAMDQRCVAAGARVVVAGAAVAVAAAVAPTPTLAATLPRLRALRLSTPDVVHAALVPGCYSGYGRLRRLDLVGSQEQAAASLSAALPLCCMRARNGAQAVAAAAAQAAAQAAAAQAAAAAQQQLQQQQQQQQQAVAVPA